MEVGTRRKLDAADAVRQFNRTHPSEEPAMVTLAEQLDERCERAQALAQVQTERDSEVRSRNSHRRRLRRQLRVGLLRVISRAGRAAAKEDPSLEDVFEPVRSRLPSRTFITVARALIASAREHTEALTSHGGTAAVIEQASGLVEQYVTLSQQSLEARNARVEAVSELKEVTAEVMDLIDRLGAFNRHRYVDDPELLVAWESARNVLGPFRSENGASVDGSEVEGSESSPSGASSEASDGDVDAAA